MNKKTLLLRYTQYLKSNFTSIFSFYEKPSTKKYNAENKIKETINNTSGADLKSYRVIGGSCHQFTAGWLKTENGKKYFIFETSSNTYKLEI